MKAIILPLVLVALLTGSTPSDKPLEAPQKPITPREAYLAACNISLSRMHAFLKERHVLLMYRFYDITNGMIIENYATVDNEYAIIIGIVASGKLCILSEGGMFKDLRGFPI